MRMTDCARELHSLLKEERLAGATLLVLANKQDIEGSIGVEEILRKHLHLDRLEGKRHWSIRGCSAVTGNGIDQALSWLIDDVSHRLYLLD
jgi:ADP-ribosylation factor-like protein 2